MHSKKQNDSMNTKNHVKKFLFIYLFFFVLIYKNENINAKKYGIKA